MHCTNDHARCTGFCQMSLQVNWRYAALLYPIFEPRVFLSCISWYHFPVVFLFFLYELPGVFSIVCCVTLLLRGCVTFQSWDRCHSSYSLGHPIRYWKSADSNFFVYRTVLQPHTAYHVSGTSNIRSLVGDSQRKFL